MSHKEPKVDKSGWLYKQGEARKSWKKRFMKLCGDKLYYYSSPKDATPKGVFSLTGYDVRPLDFSKFKKKFAFEICHAELRTYYMYAETQEEQESWQSFLLCATVKLQWGGVGVAQFSGRGRRGRASINEAEAGAMLAQGMESLPRLRQAPAWMRRALLRRKMILCTVQFNFHDPKLHEHEKEQKRLALLELIDYCDNVRGAFNDPSIFHDLMRMIQENLCRSLPSDNPDNMDEEDEEGCFAEPSWPHISIVYETLLRVVQSNEIELPIKKKYIDSRFVVRLLELFNSQDMREREYLKTITHRIYGKLTNRRALIRRSISNIFFDFIYETEKHAGIAELLEILGSIINGFAVPVKQDHVKLLKSALIPLHKVKTMQMYHAHLVYCMAQYIEKEQRFAVPIIGGVLKYYPFGNTGKELLFLDELQELVEVLNPQTLAEVEVPIYQRLAQCIEGEHFQIAEKALHFWGNEILNQTVVDMPSHRAVIFPIVFRALYRNKDPSTAHWQASIRDGAIFVLQRYESVDPELYEQCVENYVPFRPGQTRK